MKNCKVQKLYTILAPVLVFVTLLFSCPLIVHADDPVPLPYSPGMIDGYTLTSYELTSLQSLINEINDIFGKISTTVKGTKVAEAAGLDVGGLIGGLLGSSSSKKNTKNSSSSSSGLGSIIKSLFK